ncbi:alpha/beta hydrolase-fold protein [Thalassotalea ganghwensis]
MRFISLSTLSILLLTATQAFAIPFEKTSSVSENTADDKELRITKDFGKKVWLESEVLNEQRELLINLPSDYPQKGIQYPVLYVLDGNSHFKNAVLSSELLHESGKMPQVIVVAIANNTGQRMRDAYDDRSTFIRFIEKEVIPYIDSQYVTSQKNILFGHSAMGMVTMTALATKAMLFDYYIASSSAMDSSEQDLYSQLDKALAQRTLVDKSLYFSVGDKLREGQGFVDASINLAQYFSQHPLQGFDWQREHLGQQNHTSVAYPALFKGLSAVFSDYEAPALTSYQGFIDFGGLKGLTDFFTQRGKAYGDSSQIPYHILTGLAFNFMAEGKVDEGIELLEQRVDSYQQPTRIYGAIAFLYEQKKMLPEALTAYQQALKSAKRINDSSADKAYYQSKVAELQNVIHE